jgi:hypothetical protein
MKGSSLDKVVTLNVPVLSTVRDRLFEIQKQIHAANLSLTLQRIIFDWRPKPEAP